MIDLHLHLDGAISLKSARQLAQIESVALPQEDEKLREMMCLAPESKDFKLFFSKFGFIITLLQTPQSMTTAVYNLCEELKCQGIRYAEIRYAPQNHLNKGMTQEECVLATIEGLRKSEALDENNAEGGKNCGFRANLILCCMRTAPTAENIKKNRETIALVGKYLGKGVCGADLAGPEMEQSTDTFKEIFKYAIELNVPFEIHAGESSGPESIRQALKLGASRIGHGVRCIEDPELVKELAQKKIPLMVCPTSNVQTCTVNEISDLPVRRFLSEGVLFTINTDDPSIEGTNLVSEWHKSISTFNLTDTEIRQIMLNAANAAFCSQELKKQLREELNTNLIKNY